MFMSTEDFEDGEKPIKVGIISSQLPQYSKNAVGFQQPWTITIKDPHPIVM